MPYIDFILERLKNYSEIELIELLNITTEDLIEKFQDRVLVYKDKVEEDLDLSGVDENVSKLEEYLYGNNFEAHRSETYFDPEDD